MRQWWVVPGPDGGFTELRTVPEPEPGPGQVLVEVRATAINRGELIARPQLRSDNPKAAPLRSGIEFAGVIAAVGGEVAGWSPGDRVMGRGSGCHAEFCVVDHRALMAIPETLSFEQAGAIPNVFVTAHDAMVSNAGLVAGESVLVTAGSSGVGTAAIQIAAMLGAANVVATTRSPGKIAPLLELGCTDVIDTTEPGWSATVVERVGPIDAVIDQVGGVLFGPALQTLGVGGRYVTVGRNGGASAEIDLDLVAKNRLHLIGVTFRTRSADEALACSTSFAEQLLPAVADGRLTPVIDRVFPLDELQAAHRYMAEDGQFGKIVLVP